MYNVTPLLVKTDLFTIKDYFNSEKFITKIFDFNKKDIISNLDDNNKNNFLILKKFNIDDLKQFITFNDYIDKTIIPKIKNIIIELKVEKTLILESEDKLIYKFICYIDKPNYIKKLLADQYTVYYIKAYPHKEDSTYIALNYTRKFIMSDDPELNNDEDIINNNTIQYDEKYDKIQFNNTLLLTASAFLGEEVINDIIIPFVYTIFDDFINKVLNKRIKNYFKKKKLEVLTIKC
tara:strand:+ start:4562 stop:5266 length:705 start_codon:yes stop_codon:yes gene_type:complete